MHTVQELQEDGCEAAALAAGTQVAPLAELVAEGQPLFLQQHLETFQSPVEGIAQQLHQRHHLQREGVNVQMLYEEETGHSTDLQNYQSTNENKMIILFCAFLLDCGVFVK